MINVDMEVDGDELTIKVDLSERHGPSSSGKTEIVASTQGNEKVPGHENVRVGLNVFAK